MAENDKQQTIRQLTRQRFQEEVARELGIDIHGAGFPEAKAQKLERDLHADGEGESQP